MAVNNSGTHVFVDKMEDMIQIYNHTERISFEVIDKEGNIHYRKKWFVAPLSIIEEAINLIVNDDITKYEYNSEMKLIVKK